MAADTDAVGFGRVSRNKGTVFRYALLVATLVGILSVAILLAYVAVDAIRPFTADAAWWLTYAVTFALPTAILAGYYRRRDASAGWVGTATTALIVGSLFLGAGIAIVLIDVVPLLYWLGVAVSGVIALSAVAIDRRVRDGSPTEQVAVGAAVLLYSLVGLPGVFMSVPEIVASLPTVPTERAIMLATVALPGGLLTWFWTRSRYGDRTAAVVGGVTAVAGVAGSLVGPTLGAGVVESVVLPVVVAGPLAAYVTTVREERPEDASGFLLPAVIVGGMLLGRAVVEVIGFSGPESWVDWRFLTVPHSRIAAEAGVYPALVGSILLMMVVATLSFPIGVGAAVYLEEYASDGRFTRLIQVNISNLAGVPSVVYGLLALGVFIKSLQMESGSLLVGGIALSLLILPIVIISAQEAIRSVPESMRQASYGMGATKWQTVKNVVLPQAFPGILTGTILALGRAIGETAPLIIIAAPSVYRSVPTSLTSKTSALPLQVYTWATQFASPDFYEKALPAGVVVLLVLLVTMNSIAIVLRNRYQTEG